jgi:hypothetical protein
MCLSLNLSTLDPCYTGETSYCSHRETSYAVQSNNKVPKCGEPILYWESLHFTSCGFDAIHELLNHRSQTYEKKSSNITVLLADDVAGISIHPMTLSDETVYCPRFINDDLVNLTLSNITFINTRGNPTYFTLQECLTSESWMNAHPYMHLFGDYLQYMISISICKNSDDKHSQFPVREGTVSIPGMPNPAYVDLRMVSGSTDTHGIQSDP